MTDGPIHAYGPIAHFRSLVTLFQGLDLELHGAVMRALRTHPALCMLVIDAIGMSPQSDAALATLQYAWARCEPNCEVESPT